MPHGRLDGALLRSEGIPTIKNGLWHFLIKISDCIHLRLSLFFFTITFLLNMVAVLKALPILGILATSSFAATLHGFEKRQSQPSNFKLYAYAAGYDADTIGGYPIFYADGKFLNFNITPADI
jgi:hypothetical protein